MDFTFWLLKRTFEGVEQILNDLLSDIETNRKIPVGKEIFLQGE
ncbi:hypothetical protein SAMN05216167_104489 [Spirosoma endophyticum]|uniref:Uncharacterized protein n=1 Tax=Spirosoma endophyticum TaxID=662367 RepID=A0A1I1RZR2_9BACT|nr:hypothetical protein SAMN05216167_104489 [Spirosoma endophyticum]